MSADVRRVILAGCGSFERVARVLLNEEETYVGLSVLQNPANSYTVILRHLNESTQAGRLLEFIISGGSSACCGFGTTSDINVGILIRAVRNTLLAQPP